MNKKILLTSMCLFGLYSLQATANENEGGYFRLGSGVSFTKKQHVTHSEDNMYEEVKHGNYKGAPIGTLAWGYRFAPNARGELMLGYKVNKSGDKTFAAVPIMANAYFDLAKDDQDVKPFVGFGLGMSRNGRDMFSSTSKTKDSFAWQASLGADIKLKPDTTLSTGYRYSDLGKVNKDYYSNGRVKSHEWLVDLVFDF